MRELAPHGLVVLHCYPVTDGPTNISFAPRPVGGRRGPGTRNSCGGGTGLGLDFFTCFLIIGIPPLLLIVVGRGNVVEVCFWFYVR